MSADQTTGLPVLRSAFRLYAQILGDPLSHVRLGAPILLILVIVDLLVFAWLGPVDNQFYLYWLYLFEPESLFLALGLLSLTGLWATVLYAVRWHRYALLDERDVRLTDILPRRRHWIYLGYSVLIVSICVTIATLCAMLAAFLSTLFGWRGALRVDLSGGVFLSSENGLIPIAVSLLSFLYFGSRWCLVFPGRAIDRRVTLRHSWTLTRGRVWRIVLLIVVMVVPVQALASTIPGLLPLDTSGFVWTTRLVSSLVGNLFFLITIALGQSALSEVFRLTALTSDGTKLLSGGDANPDTTAIASVWRRRQPTVSEGVGMVYGGVFGRPLTLLRAGWPLIVLPATVLLIGHLRYSLFDAVVGQGGRLSAIGSPISAILPFYILAVIGGGIVFGYRWHRVGKTLASGRRSTVSKTFVRYVLAVLQILAIMGLAILGVFLTVALVAILSGRSLSATSQALLFAISCLGALVLCFAFTSPALASRAVGSPYGIQGSIELTRGSRTSLAILTLLAVLPLLLAALLCLPLMRRLLTSDLIAVDLIAVVALHLVLLVGVALPLAVSTYAHACLVPPEATPPRQLGAQPKAD